MKSSVGIVKRIMAAAVVAAGIAIVWVVVFGWIGMIGQSLRPAGEFSSESLIVGTDGTPGIRTDKTTSNIQLVVDRRTLDGKPWPKKLDVMGSAYFPPPFKKPGLVETPLRWDEGYGRITGRTDGKDPPAAWYFVRDNGQTGEVYVTGYDGISKLLVGYMGRDGFRASKPPLDEQFNVPMTTTEDGFRYVAQDNQNLNLDSRRIVRCYQSFGEDPADWTISLLGTDRLWEVNVRDRTVRSRIEFDGAMSIGSMWINRVVFEKLPTQLPDTRTEKQKADQKLVDQQAGFQSADVTAVRDRNGLVVFNLYEGKKETFALPEVLHDRRFSAFLIGPDQLLIDAHEQGNEYWSGGPIIRLYWISRQGKIQREQEVKLAGYRPPSPETRARNSLISIPVTIVWIVGVLLGAPLYLLQTNYVGDFASGFAVAAGYAWPYLIAVVLLAMALAWVTWRLQRKYRRGNTGAWAGFVFLFGVPGFLGYLVEHRRVRLEACRKCGEVVPRDREACAACDMEFAPPARVGTEIFA